VISRRLLLSLTLVVGGLGFLWLFSQYRLVTQTQQPFKNQAEKAQTIKLAQAQRTIVLQRHTDRWQVGAVASGPFYRADSERVRTLLAGLSSTQLENVISEQAERHADFELDPAQAIGVTLENSHAAVLARGLYGKQASDYLHLYFRFPEKPQVWLARGVIRGELGGMDLSMWRDRSLVLLAEPEITSVEILGKGYATALILSSTTWLVGGKLADSQKVNTLIGALAHLQAADWADIASPGISKAVAATVVIKSSSTAVTLRISAVELKRQQAVVVYSENEGAAWVDAARLKAILLKPSDLLAK